MATPIVDLKLLILDFINNGCEFSKVKNALKQPILVKVFRASPMFLINDREHYIHGYFTAKAIRKFERDYGFGLDNLKGKSLKITKFSLTLNDSDPHEYSCVSYLDKEIRLVIEECSLGRNLERGTDVNKFVVNICRDHDIRLAITSHLHHENVIFDLDNPYEEFLLNNKKSHEGSVRDLTNKHSQNNRNVDKFCMKEVVTCIVESECNKKISNKRVQNKRLLKKEVKDEEFDSEQQEINEVKLHNSKYDQSQLVTKINKKNSNSLKSLKSSQLKPKKIDFESKQLDIATSIIQVKPKYMQDIKQILLRTDFLLTKDKPQTKRPAKVENKRKRIASFKEYMNWYDSKCSLFGGSNKSQKCSTERSTPLKNSIKIVEKNEKTLIFL